jgi:hypothetical protein
MVSWKRWIGTAPLADAKLSGSCDFLALWWRRAVEDNSIRFFYENILLASRVFDVERNNYCD